MISTIKLWILWAFVLFKWKPQFLTKINLSMLVTTQTQTSSGILKLLCNITVCQSSGEMSQIQILFSLMDWQVFQWNNTMVVCFLFHSFQEQPLVNFYQSDWVVWKTEMNESHSHLAGRAIPHIMLTEYFGLCHILMMYELDKKTFRTL